ncbi:transcriptional regulator [Acidovorax sp. SRB_14]|uniref:helix-turn-helix domain-containing protein n=1 Tax=unclassified Acidovorax TaxID=2684926 RepID=UPI00145CC1AE|nr:MULTISPECIES: transcriptional regulator [unclassified Acidovorax]NMM77041.1 transcriptional regulator [Acidovorax sp. SRB_24]NMM79475.1 transcriptional regulator [Acidovorax sp. SRB_14]
MEIRPIHTEADYKATLKEVSALVDLDPASGTPEGDRLDVLSTLVQAWETRHLPIEAPDPIEAIKFRMEQEGLEAKDLEPYIGQRNRVYEVLNRKRALSVGMIRRLHQGLGIPAEVLIAEPRQA